MINNLPIHENRNIKIPFDPLLLTNIHHEIVEEKKSNIVGICPKCNKKHYMVRMPKTNRWCMCTNRTFIAEEKIQWTTKSNLVVDKTTNITRRRLH